MKQKAPSRPAIFTFLLLCGFVLGSVAAFTEFILTIEPHYFCRSLYNSSIVIVTICMLYSVGGLIVGFLVGFLSTVILRVPRQKQRTGESRLYSRGFSLLAALMFFLLLGSWVHRFHFVSEPLTTPRSLLASFIILVGSIVLYGILQLVTRRILQDRASFRRNAVPVCSLLIASLFAFGIYLAAGSSTEIRRDSEPDPSGSILDLPNIILFTLDTLRADHLHCYGYDSIETPNIDSIALEGALFENAIAHIGSTGPSHTSILTSQYPRTHEVLRNGYPLSDRLHLLSEILRDRGYTTAAFVSSAALSLRLGFDQGFDYFDEAYDDGLLALIDAARTINLSELIFLTPLYRIFERMLPTLPAQTHAGTVNSHVMPWLEANADRSFFLWVHYYDPHEPFTPPPPYDTMYWSGDDETTKFQYYSQFMDIYDDQRDLTGEELRRMISLYDGEVTFTDHAVGEIMGKLERLGIKDNTLVIITADHGEQLYEHHRTIGHFWFLYEPIVHIPLIFWYPGMIPGGVRLRSQVQSIDIAPTIMEALGLPMPEGFEGMSLYPMILSGQDIGGREYAFSEVFSNDTYWDTKVVRSEKWKYFNFHREGRDPELYRIDADSMENDNLHPEEGESHRLKRILDKWDSEFPDMNAVTFPPPVISQDIRKRLHSLGYIN